MEDAARRLMTLTESLVLSALASVSCGKVAVEPVSAPDLVVIAEELVESEILRVFLNSKEAQQSLRLKPSRWPIQFFGVPDHQSDAEILRYGIEMLQSQAGIDRETAEDVCLALLSPEQTPNPVLQNRSKADAASTLEFEGTREFSNSWIRIDGEEATAFLAVHTSLVGSWSYYLYHFELKDGRWTWETIDGWILCS